MSRLNSCGGALGSFSLRKRCIGSDSEHQSYEGRYAAPGHTSSDNNMQKRTEEPDAPSDSFTRLPWEVVALFDDPVVSRDDDLSNARGID